MKGRILESGEDYLETILILQNRNGEVRSVDIATEMDFSKPSVSVAMKNLREQEEIAAADACRIEHCLSAESFAAIKRHVKGE